jgi:hypothetical protein
MIPAFIENAFINRVLQHVLDGNKGSNILTLIVLAMLEQHINWALAFQGFHFQDMTAAMESAKLVGAFVVAVFGYFVGKKKAPADPAAK